MRAVCFIALCGAIMLISIPQGFALAGDEPIAARETVLAQAQENFAQGMHLRLEAPEQSRVAFDRAIASYQAMETQLGIANGGVRYNIGNCYLMSNRVGRAIASYQKALALRPGDEDVHANLDVARHRVADRFEKPAGSAVVRAMLFWQRWPGERQVIAFLLGNGVLWLTLGVRLRTLRMPRWPAVAGGLVAIVMASSLWMNLAGAQRTSGVVVDGTVIGRQGPGDEGEYEASFTRPLSAGVEFDVLEDRDTWVLVSLGDGRRTWLPRQRIEVFSAY